MLLLIRNLSYYNEATEYMNKSYNKILAFQYLTIQVVQQMLIFDLRLTEFLKCKSYFYPKELERHHVIMNN